MIKQIVRLFQELQHLEPPYIVGPDRPWQDSGAVEVTPQVLQCCVLKADVYGFGSLMRAGRDAPVRKALEDAVMRWRPPSAIAETGAGDAVLVADDDPVALAQMARHLMDDVYRAPGQPRLRIALHYGEVQTRPHDGANGGSIIVGGAAILCAARVEPVVEPGQICATEEFRAQLLERPSLWRTTPLVGPDGEGRFNVRKDGSAEADLWVRLYRLEF